MPTFRINPLTQETANAKTKETANHNAIDNVDMCPVCHQQMRLLDCNGIDSFVCVDHRVVLPCKDA